MDVIKEVRLDSLLLVMLVMLMHTLEIEFLAREGRSGLESRRKGRE